MTGTEITTWILGTLVAIIAIFEALRRGWRWLRRKPDPAAEVDRQHTEVLVEKLLSEHEARLEAESERDALRKAVQALQDQTGAKRDEALAALAEGKTDKAEALFEEIAEEREGVGVAANREAAAARRHIGALAFLHDTQKSVAAYKKATELDPDDAEGWNQLGQLQSRLGEPAASEKSFNKVLALGEHAEDKSVIAAATGNLGLIHDTRGELDKAEAMHRQALAIHKELGHKEGMANNYGNLGMIHKTRGKLDQAEAMHRQALAIHKELGHKEGMANNYSNLGIIHQIRGELDQAEAMYRQALAINKKLGRREGMAINYSNLGVIQKDRGDMTVACDEWAKAHRLFSEIGMPHMVEKTEGLMEQAGCGED